MFQDLYFLNFYTCILKSDKTQLQEDELASDTKLPHWLEDLTGMSLIDIINMTEQMKGMSLTLLDLTSEQLVQGSIEWIDLSKMQLYSKSLS